MTAPSSEPRALARAWKLALARTQRDRPAGEILGRGTGSSLEFQDRRAYAAGDDVRHLDWKAFARTDQLFVRQHREEILPRLEIVLDGSRSMAVGERKAQVALDVVLLLALAARSDGFQARLVLAGDRPDVLDLERFERDGVAFDGVVAWPASLEPALALLGPGAQRVLVSDFLVPSPANSIVRTAAARAGGLALVQVLDPLDLEPPRGAALRLVDAETGAARDVVVTNAVSTRYRERLDRASRAFEEEARRAGARFARLDAGRTLDASCRGELAACGLIAPA